MARDFERDWEKACLQLRAGRALLRLMGQPGNAAVGHTLSKDATEVSARLGK